MGIDIKVNAFEGPLDLLLHLIEKNKVDIYDIPISEITSQYLDYIRSMEEEDLDVMSDFLVMAATLLKIKAKMLLPVKEEEEKLQKSSVKLPLITSAQDRSLLCMQVLAVEYLVI